MSRKNENRYHDLIKTIRSNTDKTAGDLIELGIKKIENCINSATSAIHDGDKVDAIDSLLKYFAGEFLDVVHRYNLKGSTYLPDFVKDYCSSIDFGTDKKFPTFRFHGAFFSDKVVLELLPAEKLFDSVVGMYENALKNKIIPSPTDFEVVFAHYPDGFMGPGMGFRDVCLEISL